MKNKKQEFVLFLPGITWFTLTLFLLIIPGNKLPRITWFEFNYFDKIIHVSLFFILCLLLSLPIIKGESKKQYDLILIAIFCLVFGTSMEFVQKYFIPFRSFEVGDIIADGIGSLFGYLTSLYYIKKAPVETGAVTKTNCL